MSGLGSIRAPARITSIWIRDDEFGGLNNGVVSRRSRRSATLRVLSETGVVVAIQEAALDSDRMLLRGSSGLRTHSLPHRPPETVMSDLKGIPARIKENVMVLPREGGVSEFCKGKEGFVAPLAEHAER